MSWWFHVEDKAMDAVLDEWPHEPANHEEQWESVLGDHDREVCEHKKNPKKNNEYVQYEKGEHVSVLTNKRFPNAVYEVKFAFRSSSKCTEEQNWESNAKTTIKRRNNMSHTSSSEFEGSSLLLTQKQLGSNSFSWLLVQLNTLQSRSKVSYHRRRGGKKKLHFWQVSSSPRDDEKRWKSYG